MKILIFVLICVLFSLHSFNSDAFDAPFDISGVGRHSHVLVSSLDGTISLFDRETRITLWSVKIGGSIYSSYQAPGVVNGTYIDRGDDWNLYRYNRGNNSIERIESAYDLLMEFGGLRSLYVRGEVESSGVVVVARTGTIICEWDYSSPMDATFWKCLEEDNVKNVIIITRKDFRFVELSEVSRKVLWNVSLAEFEAYPQCRLGNCESDSMDVYPDDGHRFYTV